MSTKVWASNFLDPALNYLKANVNKLVLCSAEPTTYTQAVDTYALADAALSSGDFSGPSNGFISGRKLDIAEKTGVTVDATGKARFFALVSTSALALRYVGVFPETDLTAAQTISIGQIAIEIQDPLF